MTVSIEHLLEAQSLEPDAMLRLFEITLNDRTTILRLIDRPGGEWDGKLWEQFPIQLSGERRTSSDEAVRPSLQIFNPEGVFNAYVQAGLIERSTVSMYRVHRTHFETDVVISTQHNWYISQISEHSSQSITCQLRAFHDGPHAEIPARVFVPPEFPLVRVR